jgi:hypothetical protein
MNIDIIITAVLLVLFVVIVAVFIFSLKDYITNVDEKVDNLKNDYVPLKKHNQDIDQSKNEDSRLHTRIDSTNEKIDLSFDGNYDNLKNKPDLFDGDYMNLKNKPSNSGDYNKLINKPQLFDGEYDSLTNKPDLFDKDYNKLKNKPDLFDKDYNKLTNKPALFDKDYNKLTNKPALFDKDYNKLTNKPDLFDKDYNNLTNKPALFDGSYNNLTNKPAHYPSKWDMIDDKPASFANAWDDIDGKPSDFPTSWELIKNKPAATAPTGPIYDDSEIRGMIGGKSPLIHTHNISDIQGFDSNLSTMLTDYLANYALLEHTHTMGNIQGLSDNLNTKSAIGHRHDASDINNLQSVIDSNLPNLSGYATTSELTSGLGTKQNTLTAGTNVNISGNTISATPPNLSGYATTSALTTGLGTKQNTLTAGTNVNISGNTISATHPDLSGYATTTQLNRKQNKLTSSTDVSTGNLSVNGNITTSGTINGVSAAQFTELASGGGGPDITISPVTNLDSVLTRDTLGTGTTLYANDLNGGPSINNKILVKIAVSVELTNNNNPTPSIGPQANSTIYVEKSPATNKITGCYFGTISNLNYYATWRDSTASASFGGVLPNSTMVLGNYQYKASPGYAVLTTNVYTGCYLLVTISADSITLQLNTTNTNGYYPNIGNYQIRSVHYDDDIYSL